MASLRLFSNFKSSKSFDRSLSSGSTPNGVVYYFHEYRRSPCQYIDCEGQPFKPTLKPTPNFDVNADVETLAHSMRCWGTDEDAIINVLGRRTCEQRMQIVNVYQAKYERPLKTDLEWDLSGYFRDCCLLLTEDPYYLMAKSIYYALKGVGTNENTIIEIIVGCTPSEIMKLKTAYIYVLRDKGVRDPKRTLESDLRAETSGYFCKMLLHILKAETPEPTSDQLQNIKRRGGSVMVNDNEVSRAVKQVREAFETPKNATASVLLNAFMNKNVWEIAAMEKEYRKATGKSMVQVIPDVLEDEFGTLLVAMVEHAVNRPKFYSEALYRAMAGAGTHDFMLMRILILRSEIDLENIRESFEKDHKSLADWVRGETSGYYEKLLLTLMNEKAD